MIPQDINDRHSRSMIESTATPGVPARAVVNPDGSNIGSETPPTDDTKNNPPYTLGWDGVYLQTITETINGVQYQKTLTWTGALLTGVSEWVQL